MFPVIDVRGNVVAFSGRTMGDDARKYVNTRDTQAFKKSRTLYALNVAKNSEGRRMIVAEGQMDVIAIHQAGYDCAVAALGTALTDEHARMISRYADEVVLAYDGDEAGQKATRRAIDTFKNTHLLVKVLSFEGAKDPDEFIRANGPEAFGQLLETSGNSIEYELGRVKLRHDLETDGGRVRYLQQCADILARNGTPTERDLYAGRVADIAGITKQALLVQIEQNRRRLYRQREKQQDRNLVRGAAERLGQAGRDGTKLGAAAAERKLIALLFANPDLCDSILARLDTGDFVSGEVAEIYTGMAEVMQSEQFSGFGSLSLALAQNRLSLLSGILAENNGVNFTPQDADYLIEKMLKPHSKPDDEAVKRMSADELKNRIENKKLKK
jgi:DNA primase